MLQRRRVRRQLLWIIAAVNARTVIRKVQEFDIFASAGAVIATLHRLIVSLLVFYSSLNAANILHFTLFARIAFAHAPVARC